jgi:hypothetical protein
MNVVVTNVVCTSPGGKKVSNENAQKKGVSERFGYWPMKTIEDGLSDIG